MPHRTAHLPSILLGAALVALPLGVVQLTADWNAFDFAAMAVLLLAAGALFAVAALVARVPRYRLLVGGIVALAFFAAWAELAVGVFGTPVAGS
ncbi:MAG: hypothetical protein IT303_13565 [Dehalococcoidia bacterium]|nr:hypothetical protein [Dehalococcoidia bacterium]